MKKAYRYPDLELIKLLSAKPVTASGDNDLDVEEDTDWGDFG